MVGIRIFRFVRRHQFRCRPRGLCETRAHNKSKWPALRASLQARLPGPPFFAPRSTGVSSDSAVARLLGCAAGPPARADGRVRGPSACAMLRRRAKGEKTASLRLYRRSVYLVVRRGTRPAERCGDGRKCRGRRPRIAAAPAQKCRPRGLEVTAANRIQATDPFLELGQVLRPGQIRFAVLLDLLPCPAIEAFPQTNAGCFRLRVDCRAERLPANRRERGLRQRVRHHGESAAKDLVTNGEKGSLHDLSIGWEKHSACALVMRCTTSISASKRLKSNHLF